MSNKQNPKNLRPLRPSGRLRLPTISNEFTNLPERVAHNENINVAPSYLENLQIIGERGILVKMFKFTEHTTSRGGLINLKYLQQTSEGGQPTFTMDDFNYQARGVIHSVSPEAQKSIDERWSKEAAAALVPGATIWINPGAMTSNNRFIYDRVHPLVDDPDFILIHPSQIEGVESSNAKYDIKFLSSAEYAEWMRDKDTLPEVDFDDLDNDTIVVDGDDQLTINDLYVNNEDNTDNA